MGVVCVFNNGTRNQVLFSQTELAAFIKNHEKVISNEMDGLSEIYIGSVDENELRTYFHENYDQSSPVLLIDQKYQLTPETVKVDVRNDPTRIILNPDQSSLADGQRTRD